MTKGEQCVLTVKSEYGYSKGNPEFGIPANHAPLKYEVSLISFVKVRSFVCYVLYLVHVISHAHTRAHTHT